jgi:hypothetical protein
MISYFAFDGGNNNNKNISQNTKKIIPITQMSETKNVNNIDTLKVNNIKQNNNIEEQKLSNQNVINELNLVQVFKYRRNKINPEIMEIDTLYYTQEKVNMLREEQKKLRKNEITQIYIMVISQLQKLILQIQQ